MSAHAVPAAEFDGAEVRSPLRIALAGIAATFAISFRRLLRSKFFLSNVVLASLPVGIAILIAVVFLSKGSPGSIVDMHKIFQWLLRILYLGFILFFVANIFGFAVMRQELDDRTLHYFLLQPVSRWVLVAGKLAAYLVMSTGVCVISLWLTYLILTAPVYGIPALMTDLFADGRFVSLLKESGVVFLALLAYGTIAMLMGSLFKSGAYAIVLLVWEAGLPYLPTPLKLWTVMHYLHSLLPERLTEQRPLFELLGEPASVALSLGVIGGVSAVFIVLCTLLFQLRECTYTEV